MSQRQFYKPKGALNPACAIAAAAMCFTASLIIGGLIGAADSVGSVKLSIVVAIAVLLAVGAAVAVLTRVARVQYPWFAILLCFPSVGLAAYGYAVIRAAFLTGWDAILWNPLDLILFIIALPENLTTSDQYTDETREMTSGEGWFFVGIRLAFACMGMMINPIVTWAMSRNWPPYCAVCRKWISEPIVTNSYALSADKAELKEVAKQFKNGVFEPTDSLAATDNLQGHHFTFEFRYCEDCCDDIYLDVAQVTVDAKDSSKNAKTPLVRKEIVPIELLNKYAKDGVTESTGGDAGEPEAEDAPASI